MNSKRYLILAHGAQSRMSAGDPRPKQFLPISDGESIIERTVRLVSAYGEVMIWAPLRDPWTKLVATVWDASIPSLSIVHSLRTSYPLWRDGATILLGDVVFSKQLLNRMAIASPTSALFFGRDGLNTWTGKAWGEIYAIKIPFAGAAANLYEQLPETGKLWDVLGYLSPRADRSMYFRQVTDYTDDIDTPEDVARILPKLRALVAEELHESR